MLSLIIAAVTIAIVVYLLVKGYYPQAALFIGGLILLTCTWVFGLGTLLPAKTTTHFGGFDVFKVFSDGFASRIGGLGLMLMAIGGFSRYMEHVGASSALFRVFEKPLKHIHNPYLLLGAAFIVEQIMVIFVPSHAGLGLLLMCTLYPILVRSGVSPLSALGVIGCCQFLDVGPGSGNANMAAQVAGMDVSEYFVYYQLPLFIALVVILTFVHMFVQAWWDKREGWKFDPKNVQTFAGTKPAVDVKEAPKIYAILPVIPLFLIIFFAQGLIKSGAMGTLITAADQAGFGLAAMVIVGGLILWLMAFIMGSGNAAFFSFAPLVPPIAKTLGVSTVSLIFPLQVLVSFGRVSSPITAALIAISGIAGVSSFQVAKRTCIPMFVATIVSYAAYFLFWYHP